MVVLDVAQRLEELLHRGCLQFAGAHLSLLDEVLDLGLLGLLDGILVSIGGSLGMAGGHGRVNEVGSGNDTVGHLDFGNFHLLLAECGLESEVKLALLHGRVIREGVLHRVVAAELVGDFLVVTLYLLTLERGRLSLGGSVAIAQHRLHGNDGFFLHVFFGKAAVDRYRNFSAYSFER